MKTGKNKQRRLRRVVPRDLGTAVKPVRSKQLAVRRDKAMTTYEALKPLADAALQVCIIGYNIAIKNLSDQSEYERGADLMSAANVALEKINQVAKRHGVARNAELSDRRGAGSDR